MNERTERNNVTLPNEDMIRVEQHFYTCQWIRYFGMRINRGSMKNGEMLLVIGVCASFDLKAG